MAETATTSSLGWDNFYSTTTTASITATTTTIPLATPPTPTEGFLVLDPGGANEIIFYNSVSGNNVIVPSTDDRGRGDTTAQAHSSGITVKMNTVGQMFEALQAGTALASSAVSTAKIANDAVTDAKLVYGKVRQRKGGSSTDWTSAGTNNYDYSGTNTFIQCGVVACTAGSNTVTFPVAFSQKPIVIVSTFSAGSANTFTVCKASDTTTTQTNIYQITSAGAGGTTEIAAWIAIGE